jgi:hypothetical protein
MGQTDVVCQLRSGFIRANRGWQLEYFEGSACLHLVDNEGPIRILAISGSLRRASSNSAIARHLKGECFPQMAEA